MELQSALVHAQSYVFLETKDLFSESAQRNFLLFQSTEQLQQWDTAEFPHMT